MSRKSPVSTVQEDDGIGLNIPEEPPVPPSSGLPITSMSTSWLVILFKIEIHLRFIQTLLKIYASLVNYYPYALTPNAKQRFDEYQQKYHRECKECKLFQHLQTPLASDTKRSHSPVESAQKLLQRGTMMQQYLQHYLRERLQQISHNFRDGADDFLVLTVSYLRKNLAQQKNILPTSVLTLDTQTLREQCVALDKAITPLLER
jgi:hypothetical protein